MSQSLSALTNSDANGIPSKRPRTTHKCDHLPSAAQVWQRSRCWLWCKELETHCKPMCNKLLILAYSIMHLNYSAQYLVLSGINVTDAKWRGKKKLHGTSFFSILNSKFKVFHTNIQKTENHEPVWCHGKTTEKYRHCAYHLTHMHAHKI